MQHLTAFLTRLQTFELRIIKKAIYKGTGFGADVKTEIPAYDLQHETPYYDPFTFKSELRLGKDMALIDLLAEAPRLKRREAAGNIQLYLPPGPNFQKVPPISYSRC